MAKYSSFQYGDGTKYGAGEQDANLRWGFIVAWDGYYGWGNEANKMVSLSVRRGRQSMIAPSGRGFEAFRPGEATAIFDNTDGRYDPYNSSSPIYGHITPGKFVRISVRDEENSLTYQVMWGIIKDIQPVKQRDVKRVRITVIDGLRWLMDRIIGVGLQQNIDKDFPSDKILDYANWPVAEWPHTLTPDETNQVYWWAWQQNAFDALMEWNEAEAAVAFHARDGRFIWRPRSYGSLRITEIGQSSILDDIGRPQPWEIVRNIIRVNVQTKILDTDSETLWTMRDTPAIADGETFYVEPLFRYTDWQPCGAAVSFNFTVNAEAGGGGADLSSGCTLAYDTDIGEGARLWLTNHSGTDGYIIAFTAIGDAVYAPNVDFREADDDTSQASYGPRTLAINSRWVEDSAHAKTLADWILTELKDPVIHPIIQLEDQPALQFTPDLWDEIILTVGELDITAVSYRVGHIEHQTIGDGCQGVRTIFQLEPYLQEGDDMAYKGCRVYRTTTAQEIPNATATAVEFNAENHDVTGWHSNSVNPSRLTVPAGMAGYYRVYAQLKWEPNIDNARILYIRKNGGATSIFEVSSDCTSATYDLVQTVVSTVLLAVGDYLEVFGYQNSGVALDVQKDSNASFFGVDFLGT